MEPQSLFESYSNAVAEKDLDAFTSIYDENVYIFDTWQLWDYKGLHAWREMVKSWFTSLGTDKDVVTFEDVQMRESGDLVVFTSIMKFTAVSPQGEELRFLQNRLTWVAQKKENVWKIIHQHSSSPVDFETMQVMLSR
jgi:uncharacterized protein (TIGR02246 family)